ncbi:MAG: oligosaccharide flippase family protein [Erythrobacter sp.]|jgi:O-antigen/teichoic acid export membrane protein|nr:oligosaccharide flippase family protein [Erythrobacter sp.]
MSVAPFAKRWSHLEGLVRARIGLLGQIGWVSGTFAAQQVVRLLTNVALAWLLSPALLGTMMLVNVLRTGGELLSDVGIWQSIVHNRRGAEPEFLETAWTLAILRGLLLFAIACAGASAIATLYDEPQLRVILPVAALIFVLMGFVSPGRHLLRKRMGVKRLALFDLGVTVLSLFIHLVLALISPTIWALVGGLLLSGLASTVGSYFLIPGIRHQLRIDGASAREILSFGKWIFLASLVYFLSMNFDRLYLADAVPFALLGVYAIARTFSDTLTEVFQRLGQMLIFPRVSASELRGDGLRRKVAPIRKIVVFGMAPALAAAISLADFLIMIAYDDRYVAAGLFLTILLAGTWFAVLGALSDAIVMGMGKPSTIATSNAAKLAVIAVALPLALPQVGFAIALFVIVAGEFVRFCMLSLRQRALGIGFARQDLAATMLLIICIVVFREASGLVGITSGLDGWAEILRASHD